MDVITFKHGSWILFTIVWLLVNILQKKESGYMSGIPQLITFLISTILYLVCWIIWSIIY